MEQGSITVAELRRCIEVGSQRNPELAGRIEQAVALIATREITYVGEGLYRVPSQHQSGVGYYVSLEAGPDEVACQCPDAVSGAAPFGMCKHRIAAVTLWSIGKRRQRQAAANDRVMLEVAAAARAGVRVM